MVNSTNERRKNLIINQRSKYGKPLIFAVVSFLIVGLICVQSNTFYAFALPPRPEYLSSGDCRTGPEADVLVCCWTDVDPNDPEGIELHWCQACNGAGVCSNVYPDPRAVKHPLSPIAPPPSGVAPPPSTQTCPENTVLDANGNCAPMTKGPIDQGTTQSPDNTPSKHKLKLPKGGGVLEQPQTGELTTNKKGSNSDNSPTPPACPDKGPIPPNCTLKIKF